ncbi:MAG: major capsid protein [Microviridae sp.]|nr:MAG: major capsid protein [Microviridae sp.]
MSITKSIGKNTLGGGKKMEVNMRTYSRSTHDLSYVWRNTQSVGTLVPFINEVALPGDTFEIGLNADVMTHPTLGPLFGSFKLQMDTFFIPIRLYNRSLHMNKLGIGLDMAKIKLPMLRASIGKEDNPNVDYEWSQINPSCLLNYLGLKGWGTIKGDTGTNIDKNAVPLFGYWDIFKNYYANKQEELAYYIGGAVQPQNASNLTTGETTNTPIACNLPISQNDIIGIYPEKTDLENYYVTIAYTREPETAKKYRLLDLGETAGINQGYTTVKLTKWNKNFYEIISIVNEENTQLNSFPLKNIDDLREKIFMQQDNVPFIIDATTEFLPYSDYVSVKKFDTKLKTFTPQFGLALKTYQSDILNNWINTEWIDGAGGINEITAIDTSSGSFNLDTLNLSKKVYDMLNRIAVSGGTYKDWIETVYTNGYVERSESPVYHGGMSQEIAFQEVVSNSATENEPLGSLAGRGRLVGDRKGGFIKIKVDEPGYIMGIVSITPRIDYAQGNKWDTQLKTLDDLHKPQLDAIGFQDLITERMAWWDTQYTNGVPTYRTVGKQPAWLNYMTNVNETHGNFAIKNSEAFMVLNRNYEMGTNNLISDLTTYIDPVKYNYIFADTNLDAMNFWVQIGVNIKARRKMSAKVIPNL